MTDETTDTRNKCQKAVRWNTPGVCCDSCDRWYHQSCMGMSDGVYQGLKNVSWECFHCGVPNFSTSLFDTTIFETSSSFSYLSESACSDISFSNPVATSSPSKVTPHRTDLPMRVLVLNTQSIKSPGKPAQLQTFIRTANADIVIGSESWLNQNISSSEVFPPDFTCYRNDRSSGKGGGVFLLVSNQYDSYEPEELKAGDECELVGLSSRFKVLKIYILDPSTDHQKIMTQSTSTICRSILLAFQRIMGPIYGLVGTST